MNKKNTILIAVGIFLVSVQLHISFGYIIVDAANDLIGFLLIIIGVLPMRHQNSIFKKSFFVSILGLIAAVVSQAINCIEWITHPEDMHAVAMGLPIIFTIYFTYYFTEAMIMESRVQEKSAVTHNYRISWFVLSASIFAHYFLFKTNISIASIMVKAVVAMCALYYCYLIYSTARQLYEE